MSDFYCSGCGSPLLAGGLCPKCGHISSENVVTVSCTYPPTEDKNPHKEIMDMLKKILDEINSIKRNMR